MSLINTHVTTPAAVHARTPAPRAESEAAPKASIGVVVLSSAIAALGTAAFTAGLAHAQFGRSPQVAVAGIVGAVLGAGAGWAISSAVSGQPHW